jgi:PIN domain nuclease of toxin-antitoxin system
VKHLVDTHVLVWWLFDDRRLPRQHARILTRAEKSSTTVGVAGMTLWEIAKLVERGRLELTIGLDECLEQIESSSLFSIVPLDARIAAESTRLGENFPSDPVDQIIAATARCHGLTLLTADERILASRVVSIA